MRSLQEMIDGLPQNRPLYRDSDLWQIKSDDMDNALFQQGSMESFHDFITRCYYESRINKLEDILCSIIKTIDMSNSPDIVVDYKKLHDHITNVLQGV